MAISLGDIEKRNKKQQEEAFNYHWENQNGLWRRTSKSWNEQKKQEEEQELLRKQAEDRQGFFKSGNENGILGTLASGIDAVAKFGEGMSRTLEGQVDWMLYTTADQNKRNSDIAKNLFGENNFISNFNDFLRDGFMDTAKHNSTADIFGTDGQNSLFENMMWASGTAEKEAAKKSREILGKDNWITKGLEIGSNARLNASQLRDDGKNWRATIDESSYLGDTSKQIFEGAGNIAMMAMEAAVGSEILGMAGMTTINPMTGATELSTAGRTLLTFSNSFTSAYGNARSTAYDNGADDITAHRAGFINGVAEGFSELMFDAMPGIKSPGFAEKIGIKDWLTNKFTKALGKNVGKVFFKVTGGLEEGFEEMMSNAIVALGNDFMHMIDENYTYGMENQTGDLWEDFKNGLLSQESIDSFVSAGLTSVLLGAGGTILNTAQTNQVINAYAKDNGMTFKEAKALFDSVAKQTGVGSVQDQVAGEGGYNNIVEQDEMTRNRIKNYMKASSGTNVEANLREYAIREAQEQGKTLTEVELNKRVQELRNLAVDEVNSPNKYTQFTQEAKNENDAELIKSLQDTNRNNTRKSHQLYEFADKIQSSREGVKVRFVNNEMIKQQGIKVDGTINGYNQNGVVYINVDGKNPYQQIAYHEIAHSIKDSSPELYQQLSNLILQSANENDLEQYKKMYGVKEGYSSKLTEDYRDEYVNDKLGEKLNDDKFIDNLTDNRNALQKLIDEIKRVIKYMTSNREKRQLMDIQHKIEQKYKEGFSKAEFKGNGKTNLMLAKHYGDLGKGNDTYYFQMANSRRSTGHFGTGTYFVNEEYQPGESSSYANRPTQSVEFDDYNLFRPQSANDGFDLHDALKEVNYNNNPISQELYNELTPYYEASFGAYNELLNEEEDSNYSKVRGLLEQAGIETEEYDGYNSLEYERDLEDKITDVLSDYDRYQGAKRDLQRILGITDEQFDKSMQEVRDAKARYDNTDEMDLLKADSLSTIFMKSLGYNGIDVTGYDQLDNTTYGSVIYDLSKTKNTDINLPKYSLSQDSQGRELTQEQQDYFKDSKVRDDEGRLIPMYHGTTGEFNEFDRDLAGNHGTYYGAGFYFTKDLDSAKDYAKMNNGEQGRVIESYLNITNPYIPTADTINEDGSVNFAPSFYEDFENRFKDDVNLITDWDTLNNRQKGRAVRNILQDNGYDGVINGDNYVVFESNQVKNVDNTNPTSNPDIRYSLSEGFEAQGTKIFEQAEADFQAAKQSILDYLEENDIKNPTKQDMMDAYGWYDEFDASQDMQELKRAERIYSDAADEILRERSNTDSTGKELTKEQQEYFKDSKVRDDNGNLKVMYHGTPTGGFTIFDNNQKQRDVGFLGKGFYFTGDIEDADEYSKDFNTYDYTDNSKVYENYLNITNPYIIPADTEYRSDMLVKILGVQPEQIQKTLIQQGYDGIIYDNPAHNEYVVFNSNQIKNVDNTNPTSNPDIRYSLSPEIQDKVNHSMSMDDMSRLLDMAFAESDIEEYSDGAVTNVQEWLDNEDWNYQIPLIAENTQVIQEKYLNNLDDSFDEDYTFEDILEAYKNKTLVGKEKASRTNLDLSKDTGRIDSRFYSPQNIEATKELYDKANQRVTNSNRDEVYKARADFIIAAHDKNTASKLGLTQQEVNSKLKSWANYPKSAMEISNRVNEGVARENQWSGLENSSIVNYISVTDDQMKSMVKEVKGKSDEYQRKYITSAMLALDTHIDYSKLTFEFGVNEELAAKHANGDYFYETDTIRVRDASQNTIAHEMGHYINSVWAREIFGFEKNPMGSPLTAMALRYNHDVFHLTDEQQQFLNNFNLFIDDLQNSAVLKTGSNRGIEYWQDRDEVFARFVAKFTEWTKNQATNGRFDYESRYYSGHGDSFTTKQYMDFIKILQEKSALESMTQPKVSYSLSQSEELTNYIEKNNYTFKDNGNLEVSNLTDKQINELVKIYHTTGYDDVDASYLKEMLKRDKPILMREVADRFIEKELGHKPQIDTTKVFEDSEGNSLTQEQVNFFKDSGVRDIRGRLIPVYHRTNADFTIFDSKAGKQHGNKYGKGFYFSIVPENYGNNTMKVYLNAKDGEYKYIPKAGYYIVQDANMIKNVDNTNPTSNPDIRYSLSVEQANTGTDNTGRQLSNEQKEYFKNSKVTDENGNLIEVYHTTTDYNNQFNEFNPVGTPGYKYGDTAVNFYTDSKEMSSSYGYNLISPDTARIESMEDVNKRLGDRYRLEEKDGKYEIYDKYDEQQIKNYNELIKLFNEEQKDILNRTWNKSRGDLLRELSDKEFDLYDRTRKTFLNLLYKYDEYTGIENNQINRTFDEIIADYLESGQITPYRTYNSQNDLYRNVTSATSPYEHYQYNGYLNMENPYVIEGNGKNWNDIITGENQDTKSMYNLLTNQEKQEMTELANLVNGMYDSFEDKYLGFYQRLLANNEELYDKVTNDNSIKEKLFTAALNNWDERDVADLIGKRNTTNDIVKQVLEMNKNGSNYDGVIINNIKDYGINTIGKDSSLPNNVYVTFNSNQFKAADNKSPTQDSDIRYSLSADGLKNLANELGESYSMLESNLTGRDRAGIKRYLENYTGIVDKYLADNNIQVEPAYRDIEFTRVRTPELQQFVKDNDLTIEKLANDQELQDKYFDLWFGDANEEKFTKQWRDLLDFVKDNPREGEIPRPLRAIQREMQQIRDGETQEIDESATKSKKLDAAIDNGYDFWIEEQITPLFEKIDYDADEVMEEAKANHGTTDDYNTGAYMTTDGSLLDFDDGGYRDDHRTISVFNLDMQEFMDYGAIRMKPEANGFEMAIEPTTEQYSRLEDYIDNYLKTNAGVHGDNSTIWVDFDIPGTNNYNSASYNINTPTSKIINDIKEYWRTGELPKQSEYADFYYSLSKDTQQTANGLEGTARIESYEDYLRSLPSYKQLQQESSTNTNLPFEGNHGILTKEDYKNKKIEMFNKRIQQADNRMEKAAKKFARENMALNQETRAELDDLINEYKGMSREEIYNSDARQQIKDFVAKNSRQEFVEEVIDEDVRDLQKAIRNTTFTIDQSASGEFADGITQFKKNNPGIKIKYGRQDIDTKYQELAEQYPGMLEQDVTDKDIPFILADFMKKPYRRFNNTNVQVFELSPEEVDNIANRIYYGLTNNAISDEEVQSITKEISDKVQEKYGRQMAKAKYTEFAKDLLEQIGLENIKDKKTGYGYKTNTMKRNLRDVINSKEKAQLFYDEVFKPITIHNAQAEIDRQEYNNRILKYNINNDESVYIQMLGELKYNPETDLTTAQVEEFAQKHNVDKQKCTEAVEEFRNIYDELFDRISEAYRANGYKPLEYRKGYFPHFIEDKPTSIIGKLAKGLGWNTQKGTLPTDLAGLTDMLEPGRAWTPFSQQRTGDATDYNALKGMDNYLRGAMDVIYHTEDIQRIRAIENEIRYDYSSKGIQDKIDAIRQNQDLSPEEQAQEIASLVDNQQNNPLGNFVTELRDYANGLANKKSILDRGMEQLGGREWYSRMQQINSRVSANMVGMNISSAITNFIPLTQGWSQISTKNMLRAMYESVQNIVRNDGFDLNSVYLTNRTQQAENLYMTRLDTINKKLGALFEGIDSFTANTLVRGKYLENLDKGMSEQQAIENADEFAKDVMAGRSKGDAPTIFNSKNPLIRLFTAFQLEVNNQYGYMFKDLPLDMGGEAKDKLAMAFVKMFIGAWLYNWITEKITGRKAAFSPIDMAIDDYKTITNENMDFASKVEAIAKDTAQELPFVSGIMGGGRLPIQGAIPYENPLSMVLSTFEDAGKAFDADEEKKQTAINNLKKEWLKPVYFLALPFGGGQFKKMNEGMAMYDENLPVKGSYTNAGKLRFEADTSPLGMLQSLVFGQYASQNARDYFENGYTPLSQKQINEALDANLPISDYREINQGISNARALAKANKENQTAAMYDYINSLPLSDEQKNKLINSKQGNSSEVKDDNGYIKYTDGSKTYWYDAENDIVYNSKYKEVKKDINELTKYSNMKDVSNYDNYGSYEEFTYATNNPTKYNVIKQITDYEQYNIYKDEIAAIKENYKTTEGRKKAVAKYINGLNLNQYQKMMLYKEAGGYSIKNYSKQMQKYIDGLDIDVYDKYLMYDELFGTSYAKSYKPQANLPTATQQTISPPAPPTTNLPTAQPVQQTPTQTPTNLPTAAPPAPYYEPESVDEYRGLDGKTYYRDDTNNLLYDEYMNPVVDGRKYDDEFNEGLRSVKYKGNKKDLVKYYDDNNNVVWVDEETDEAYDTDYNLLPDEYYNEVQNIPNTQGSGLTRSKYNGDKSELRKFKDATGKVFYEDEETERIYDSNLNLIVSNNKLPILKPKKL